MSGTPSRDGGVTIDRGGVYQTPWALSENTFLAAYSYRHESSSVGGDNPAGFGLYCFDTFGNKELLHRDPLLSCSFPIPLKRRARPPVLPDAIDPTMAHAVCYMPDVYQGLDGVKRGVAIYSEETDCHTPYATFAMT